MQSLSPFATNSSKSFLSYSKTPLAQSFGTEFSARTAVFLWKTSFSILGKFWVSNNSF
jgi:hypothetical protein